MDDKFPFQGKGYIKYDPYRGQMKTKTKWWCVCNIDREISRYFRWFVSNKYGLEIHEPPWNGHISIIRGEKPKHNQLNLWKKYDGHQVTFSYSNIILPNNNGKFWAVEVQSDFFKNIREEFGLPSNWNQHITIGKIYNKLDTISLKMIYKGL